MKKLFILCLLLCACTTNNTVEIGGLFALTGYGAAWGTAEAKAVTLAIEEVNAEGGVQGKQVLLIQQDTKTDALEAVKATQYLLNQNIKYLIGPTWEASTSAVVPIIEESILITPSAYKSIEDANRNNLFSTYPPYGYEISSVKTFYNEKGWKRFAVIYNNEFFSEVSKEIFVEEAAKANWEVVDTFLQDTEDRDFRSILLKIQQQEVDAIYAPLAKDNPVKRILMKQKKELGMSLPVISTSSTETTSLLAEQPEVLEGLYYAFPVEAPAYHSFEEAYKKRYGVLPESPSAATAYDATKILLQALEEATTPEDVATYLHTMKTFEGVSNNIRFDEHGIVENKAFVMKTMQNGTFVQAKH